MRYRGNNTYLESGRTNEWTDRPTARKHNNIMCSLTLSGCEGIKMQGFFPPCDV